MKLSSTLLLGLFLSLIAFGKLEMKEDHPIEDNPDKVSRAWYRDGIKILNQHLPDKETGFSMCMIMLEPQDPEENVTAALGIRFTNGRISSLFKCPALKGYDFAIDDFTRDGIPDFVQITQLKEGKRKVVEAYSITKGLVEPIPDWLFSKEKEEFYYDEEIIAYLKTKLELGATGQRR